MRSVTKRFILRLPTTAKRSPDSDGFAIHDQFTDESIGTIFPDSDQIHVRHQFIRTPIFPGILDGSRRALAGHGGQDLGPGVLGKNPFPWSIGFEYEGELRHAM